MNNDLKSDNVRKFLQKICVDSQFVKSPRYTQLLIFLTEQALNGILVKEQTIGMDMFKKNYNPIKDDGKVRVYMYNLRKKLNTYYSEAGKEDSLKFVLEKGSYNLNFTDNKKRTANTTKQNKTSSLLSYRYIGFLIGIIIVSGILILKVSSKKELYLWDDFFAKNSSNLCVLADQVVLFKKNSNHREFLIHDDINSAEEFIVYTRKNEIDTLEKAGYTYLTKSIPNTIYHLSRYFFKYDSDFSRILESEFSYDETKNNNIIYIGQQRQMSTSKKIFLSNSRIFSTDGVVFYSTESGEKKRYGNKYDLYISSEYAMVSHMPLKNGYKGVYFVSNHDIGTMAVVKKFIDTEFLEEFYHKLPSPDSYFNALFKVDGINRTDVSCELIELEVVKK